MRFRHLSEEKLLDFALGLAQDSFARRHLDGCPSCRSEIESLTAASAALEAMPALSLPATLAERTFDAVERSELEQAVQGPTFSERTLEWMREIGRRIAGPVPAGLLAAAVLAFGMLPRIPSSLPGKSMLELPARESVVAAVSRDPSRRKIIAPPASAVEQKNENASASKEQVLPEKPADVAAAPKDAPPQELAPVGQDRPVGTGSSMAPLFAGASGGLTPARAATGAQASSGQSESELGAIGVELKILGNMVRVETGEKARILLKVRASIRVLVEVYTASGARAASLLDAVLEPGQREIIWDGLGAAGVPVASGVYVMAIHGTGFSETVKLVVLK